MLIFALLVMVLVVAAVSIRRFLDRPLTAVDFELARLDAAHHA